VTTSGTTPTTTRGRAAADSKQRTPRLATLFAVGPEGIFRSRRQRRIFGYAAAALAAVIVVGVALLYTSAHQGKQVTAYFREAVGVYPGSDVRILGVKVGTVDSVQPSGTEVKITMTVDHGIAVPAGADAVIVAPSVVADRYVQLTPAYTGGLQIAPGAVIPVSRTATPLEVDQLYASLNKLTTALGPGGVNKHGALSDLIRTGAANLAGNGKYFASMLTQFGRAMGTLGGSAGNLSATVDHLQLFTTMLKQNNGQVRLAEQQLADVSGFLAADRQDLAAALHTLAGALGQVQAFIAGNRSLIKVNVTRLASITRLLVTERASLAEALDDVPLAVDNVLNAYDPLHRTLDGRGDLLELSHAYGSGAAAATQVPPGKRRSLPPLPFPAAGPVYATGTGPPAGGR
jgi:phospholipid/cholesterol/gamma-HCH transport system substrate-binding protein